MNVASAFVKREVTQLGLRREARNTNCWWIYQHQSGRLMLGFSLPLTGIGDLIRATFCLADSSDVNRTWLRQVLGNVGS